MYIVLADDRESFIDFLKKHGVGTGIHYLPAHEFTFYHHCKNDGLEATNTISRMNTTLPLYYEMNESEINQVIQAVIDYDREAQ